MEDREVSISGHGITSMTDRRSRHNFTVLPRLDFRRALLDVGNPEPCVVIAPYLFMCSGRSAISSTSTDLKIVPNIYWILAASRGCGNCGKRGAFPRFPRSCGKAKASRFSTAPAVSTAWDAGVEHPAHRGSIMKYWASIRRAYSRA